MMTHSTQALATLALLTSLIGTAQAAPPISSGATVSTGIGATFDRNPATFRLQLQGELPLAPGDSVGLGAVLPLEFTTSGENSFGVSSTNSMLTFVPSLRLRVLNATFVRFYGDAGIGLAFLTGHTEGWLFEQTTHRTGWSTRGLLGLELGRSNGGITFVVEPLGVDTVHFGGQHAAGYAARIGIGARY